MTGKERNKEKRNKDNLKGLLPSWIKFEMSQQSELVILF